MTHHIKDFLKQFTRTNDWKLDLIANWPHIIGPLADKVSIESIDGSCITLGVCHPSWMQELYLMAPMLRDTINKHLKQPRIQEIRFKSISFEPTKKKIMPSVRQIKNKPVTLSKQELNTLNQINDSQLRTALKNFLIRCHQENQ